MEKTRETEPSPPYSLQRKSPGRWSGWSRGPLAAQSIEPTHLAGSAGLTRTGEGGTICMAGGPVVRPSVVGLMVALSLGRPLVPS